MPQPAEPERLSELRFAGLRITLQRSSSCKPMGAWGTASARSRCGSPAGVHTGVRAPGKSPPGALGVRVTAVRRGWAVVPKGPLRPLRMDGGAHVDGAGPAWWLSPVAPALMPGGAGAPGRAGRRPPMSCWNPHRRAGGKRTGLASWLQVSSGREDDRVESADVGCQILLVYLGVDVTTRRPPQPWVPPRRRAQGAVAVRSGTGRSRRRSSCSRRLLRV